MLKKPSAFAPVCMALIALTTLLIFLARFGVVHEADEGTAARAFQILLAGQVPIIAFFAAGWLPRFPGPALQVHSRH